MTPHEHQAIIKSQILGSYSNAGELIKSEENDIEKSGEGSKGGKVIGHTKSGKPVYEKHEPENSKDFSANDHFDANHIHTNHARSLMNPSKGTASKVAENKADACRVAAKWHDEQETTAYKSGKY